MALKWDQSERSQNFRYKVTAVSVRGLFFKFFPMCGERWQMRCRLILLITEHPIQQGIRKGGVRHFCDEDGRGSGIAPWSRSVYIWAKVRQRRISRCVAMKYSFLRDWSKTKSKSSAVQFRKYTAQSVTVHAICNACQFSRVSSYVAF